MAWLLPPGMGFPHVLCGTVPDGSKGCSQICPLASRWDSAAHSPLSGKAQLPGTLSPAGSRFSGLCWFGPTYLMVGSA